jgi:hypothetical protein
MRNMSDCFVLFLYAMFHSRQSLFLICDMHILPSQFIEGYIPGLVDPLYNKPLLACSLETLDTQHIHWEGNWAAYNLNSPHDFPGLDEAERNAYFGTVQHYPVDKGEPTQTYVQYIESHYPDLMYLLGEETESSTSA